MAGIDVKMWIGDWQVEYSSLINLQGDGPIHLSLGSVTMVFSFDTDEGTSRFQGRVDGNTINVTLFNQTSQFSSGVFEPIEVITVDDVAYSFTYVTRLVDSEKKARVFEVTLYRKKVSA